MTLAKFAKMTEVYHRPVQAAHNTLCTWEWSSESQYINVQILDVVVVVAAAVAATPSF